eukprot:scaffold2889_cov407-Prasinococcus_capsulatus_cf.AAC.12
MCGSRASCNRRNLAGCSLSGALARARTGRVRARRAAERVTLAVAAASPRARATAAIIQAVEAYSVAAPSCCARCSGQVE